MTDFTHLIQRLQDGDGPDRELDAELRRAFLPLEYPGPKTAYTSSLDAAVALIERELPRHSWTIRRDRERMTAAFLWRQNYIRNVITVEGTSPPRALLIALLKARQADTQESEAE